jgi:hypothetical protein
MDSVVTRDHANQEPSRSEDQPPPPAKSDRQKWFHFRWRVLLVVPLAVALLAAYFIPRQRAQHQAIASLKEMNAQVRTQPVLVPGLRALMGDEYAEEIIEVYLRNPQLEDEQLSVLAGIKSLQKLELAGSSVTSAGLVHLRRLTNLYTLHLADTRVSDEGMKHLSGLRGLGILSLDNTSITDAGLAHLAQLPQLERFYLDGTAITDEGLAHISRLTTLKELSCANTQISDAGLEHLKKLKNLEVLKLFNTNVTQEGMEDLVEALPDCKFWFPPPD